MAQQTHKPFYIVAVPQYCFRSERSMKMMKVKSTINEYTWARNGEMQSESFKQPKKKRPLFVVSTSTFCILYNLPVCVPYAITWIYTKRNRRLAVITPVAGILGSTNLSFICADTHSTLLGLPLAQKVLANDPLFI